MPDFEVEVMLLLDQAGFAETLQRLEDAGLVVEDHYPAVGTVTGRIARSRQSELGQMEGVLSVEPTRSVQHPPPDADVQ